MLLRQRLLAIASEKGLGTLAVLRLDSALRTVEAVLGPLDAAVVADELQLAQKVMLHGDDAAYIVTGGWADGTYDLVRESGSFPSDALVGWRPGQTLEDYKTELAREQLPVVEPDVARSASPLRPVKPDPR